MLKDDDIERVKECVSMIDLSEHLGFRVNRKGFTNCPFHKEKTGSMKMYPGTKGYYCFGCGEAGDVISFTMKYFSIGFEESVRRIASEFSIPISDGKCKQEKAWVNHRKIIRDICREVDATEQTALAALADKIQFCEYLKSRVEPLGGIFCTVSNLLPVLCGEWENLYNTIYRKT